MTLVTGRAHRSPVLRMVLGMANNFRDDPGRAGQSNEVTDWLNGRGGVILAGVAAIIVVWAVVSQFVGAP